MQKDAVKLEHGTHPFLQIVNAFLILENLLSPVLRSDLSILKYWSFWRKTNSFWFSICLISEKYTLMFYLCIVCLSYSVLCYEGKKYIMKDFVFLWAKNLSFLQRRESHSTELKMKIKSVKQEDRERVNELQNECMKGFS